MVTVSCVGSVPAANCPSTLPPHCANRMSAKHSSADNPSLMMESMSRNHTRYFTSSAPTSAMQNVDVPPSGSTDAGTSAAMPMRGNAR